MTSGIKKRQSIFKQLILNLSSTNNIFYLLRYFKQLEELNKKPSAKSSFKLENDKEDAVLNETVAVVDPKQLKKPSLGLCLCKVFCGKFLAGSFLKIIQDVLNFASPMLLE